MITPNILIKTLQLQAHPEGGYYRRTYASDNIIGDYENIRPCTTMIYYLLKEKNRSVFHRLKSDEIWIFQKGCSVIIHCISSEGIYSKEILGDNLKDEHLQLIIKGGTWFAAELSNKTQFALCTCVVSPGFDFADFEIANRKDLTQQYPAYQSIIERMTLPNS